jgi:hypothetical protein
MPLSLETLQDAHALWEALGARRCAACKKAVMFMKNKKTGKTQILTARPDPVNGNIFIIGRETKEPRCEVWSKDDAASNRAAGVPFHVDHHFDCPYADSFREAK